MRREYKILAIFAAVVAVCIFLFLPAPIWSSKDIMKNVAMAISYIAGAVLSAIAGKLGIIVAGLSNGRSAEAAKKGIKPAFLIGFRGGSVMGLIVVGCAVLGVSVVLWIVGDASILLGFSFGASSLALFAKAGAASLQRPLTSQQTLLARSSSEFPRMILVTPQLSQIT